ncbi:lipoyl(octanoyl) transferase LipB [Gluconobacter morbifer]|uniref:Octanoyltransferase n=1 Tax=Gluconobacter morbifer G707 TaxID=1088869 RepID=G6XI91_9PROT|nr:lipoyl(octanoyl) transferase LipB [Gluconobacter morbifer]EHH68531.1 lipoate-protein ligase B [Gluconobacter morbifer G707]
MTASDIYEEIFWRTSSGLTPYPDALTFMAEHSRLIRQEGAAPLVWLVEHPPVFTAGTSARDADLYNPHGYPTYEAGRGGQWTYHGPGQRLAYVLLDLTRQNGTVPPRDLRAYVRALELWLIDTLALLGIDAFTCEGRIGVWAMDPLTSQEAKIAALGIRISRWVSWHGVSVNVDPDLEDFDGIVPCGIRDFGVTSLRRFDAALGMPELDEALAKAWPARFGTTPRVA